MIAGIVRELEPIIQLTVIGTRRRRVTVEAVVDTGSTGFLSLPPAIIRQLGLRDRGLGRAILADGSICEFNSYPAKVELDGEIRSVRIDESDTMPLVGMALFVGYQLNVQILEGGTVTLTRMPA